MASPNVYPGGLNLTGTVFDGGPTALELEGAYLSGTVIWLDTIGGSNANAGTLPELPVQTMAQAVTNSAANGLIVVGSGSAETLASAQTFNLANLCVWGCGSGTSRPRYTVGLNDYIFKATANGIRFRNLYFPSASSGGVSSGKIVFQDVQGGEVRDCYFECGAADTGAGAVSVSNNIANSNYTRIEGCTFISVASRPSIGLAVPIATVGVEVRDCIFDGGSFGWSDFALKVSSASTDIRGENNSFLRRSDLGVTVTATSYKFFGTVFDGTSNIRLTA